MSINLKPIIKYNGGKSSELEIIKKFIPENINTYIEPFVGGGSIYFYLNHEKNIINDINKNLIHFYSTVKNNFKILEKEISSLENDENTYYIIRNMMNEKIEKEYDLATLFYYINRTCYRGMIRYNNKGEFNVPFGRYKSFNPLSFISEEHIKLLERTEIYNKDFSQIFEMADKEDFMFLDPPYMSQFKRYYNDFSEEDQRRLFECFKKSKANCMMVISDLGIIRELYKDYIVYEYDKTYAVNIGKDFKPVTAKHLVICNYKQKR